MNCPHCADKGIIRLKYHGGEPDEFAICLCSAGLAWRCDRNVGRATYPLWHVWAAREQVEQARVGLVEEFFEDAELRALFPSCAARTPRTTPAPLEDMLMAAGKNRKGKL
jgi:hypothetical protein